MPHPRPPQWGAGNPLPHKPPPSAPLAPQLDPQENFDKSSTVPNPRQFLATPVVAASLYVEYNKCSLQVSVSSNLFFMPVRVCRNDWRRHYGAVRALHPGLPKTTFPIVQVRFLGGADGIVCHIRRHKNVTLDKCNFSITERIFYQNFRIENSQGKDF